MTPQVLSQQALQIWKAGVSAVESGHLVRQAVRREGSELTICDRKFPLGDLGRIAVVGGGKAGAGMADAVEQVLGPEIREGRVVGWVNVPADCVRPLKCIRLHAARPAGVNEPTAEGVAGSERILAMVAALSSRDLCIVLLSGGGSALLPAPVFGLSLAGKQQVTRFLMQSGATIQELNTVRKRLSRIKGGALARASTAGSTQSLIISDVVGDPLDIIASGPTADDPGTARDALAVLEKFHATPPKVPAEVFELLRLQERHPGPSPGLAASVHNHVIGSNRVALEACAGEAVRLGYRVLSLGSDNAGEAGDTGRELAGLARRIREGRHAVQPPACILSGGEPVVHLAPQSERGRGGRNQQVALAALADLGLGGLEGITVLSGGTDGEDGPTDAAGAWADLAVARRSSELALGPENFLRRNDAYSFFERCGGLLKTGPTHTNVMDVRVVLIK